MEQDIISQISDWRRLRSFLFFFFFFWLHQALVVAHRIVVAAREICFPDQGSNHRPPTSGAQSLSHWTTREVPKKSRTTQGYGYKAVSQWKGN